MAMPVLKIEAETVAEAWEKAVIAVWKRGIKKLTQYLLTKENKIVNQESRAATALIVVKKPLKEPRTHAGDTVGQQAIISGYIRYGRARVQAADLAWRERPFPDGYVAQASFERVEVFQIKTDVRVRRVHAYRRCSGGGSVYPGAVHIQGKLVP